MPVAAKCCVFQRPRIPNSLAEMVDHTLGRVLDLFDIDVGKVQRWTGGNDRPKVTGQPQAR